MTDNELKDKLTKSISLIQEVCDQLWTPDDLRKAYDADKLSNSLPHNEMCFIDNVIREGQLLSAIIIIKDVISYEENKGVLK